MDLNDNPAYLARRAARDLALKIRLERGLALETRKFLRVILAEFKLRYMQQEEIVNVNNYEPELIGVLRNHYRKVMAVFSGIDREAIKSMEKKDLIEDETIKALSEFIFVHSELQAKVILKTVKNELDTAIFKYVEESITNAKQPDPAYIADLVYKDFARKISGKADLIALTETQALAEKTKQVEYDQIAQSGDPTSDLYVKQWVAILDDRTRPWHAAADGQRVAINEPFVVKGERLMYPGDDSLGVSLDNIINCRCSHLLVKL